ncbi:hypothetical protein FMN50_11020 [Rhodobacterales bacterium]|nr:hypothetical protein FMN50_11020 [Rhodobacterales bacterium]
MEQEANAPGVPAANRRAVPGIWRAGMCALALQAAVSIAAATEAKPAEGLTASPLASAELRLSLLETAPAETVKPALHFTHLSDAPVVRSVTSRMIREADAPLPPASRPEASRTDLAAASPVSAEPRALNPTLLLGTLGKPVSLTPVTNRWAKALGELESDRAGRFGFTSYTAILDKVRDQRRGLQIPRVNYMVNRLVSYREDARLWEASEYWASPVETLGKRAGDCEDYAILKYALLRDLGVVDEDMRIVVLRDTAARIHHAVLSVRHEGNWLILDNRFSRVRFERDLPNYQALYSVNAAGEWSHIGKDDGPVRLAARLNSATR